MNKSETSQSKQVEAVIEGINDCWLNDQLESMDMFFHKQVVLLHSGTNKKVVGREAMIESYRDFIDSSEVSDFRINAMAIDVFEETAVAHFTFRIHYRVETTNYDEEGSEILVLHYHNNRWLVVWRTQMPG